MYFSPEDIIADILKHWETCKITNNSQYETAFINHENYYETTSEPALNTILLLLILLDR